MVMIMHEVKYSIKSNCLLSITSTLNIAGKKNNGVITATRFKPKSRSSEYKRPIT
jgi:hypothetical protein